MGLFNFKKQKIEDKSFNQNQGNNVIKILGGGCEKCKTLENNTKEAIEKINFSAMIEHITDFAVISKYGVMQTPAIVLNEKVLSSGRVLTVKQIIDLLEK